MLAKLRHFYWYIVKILEVISFEAEPLTYTAGEGGGCAFSIFATSHMAPTGIAFIIITI